MLRIAILLASITVFSTEVAAQQTEPDLLSKHPNADQPMPRAEGNPRTALERLLRAASTGNVKAQVLLGKYYAEGDGVEASDSEAVRWYRTAAAHGNPIAEYRLGIRYEVGRGVPLNASLAVYWYKRAAEAGNAKAAHNLAVAYAEGRGVEHDDVAAARWFTAAANLGVTDSQFNMGVLFQTGRGVSKSVIQAYAWFSIAAAQGDLEARAQAEYLASHLSESDLVAAKRAALAFHVSTPEREANEFPRLSEILLD